MYLLFHPISSLNHLVARLVTDQISFIISIVFFIVIALNYKKSFWQSIDQSVSDWATSPRESLVTNISFNFAFFGNAVFHILFSVILGIIFFITKHSTPMVFGILFTLIFSWGLNRFMKLIYKRTRPETLHSNIKKRLSYCFPSGHVMASISIYFFCAVLLQNFVPFLPWYLIAFVISFFVIMSRIYMNHHYFTDVLSGITMGIFCLNISIWFYFFAGLL
jgi:undecaprenyl-diphosphatase